MFSIEQSGWFVMNKMVRKTDTIRYYIEKVLYHMSHYSEDLRSLKGILHGRPLLVVGNGPSLNDTPLDKFSSIPSIGMNKINLLFDRVKWRPDFILCVNRYVAKQNQEFYFNTDIPVFISWQARWFLKPLYRKNSKFFYNNLQRNFAIDISKGVGSGGTVTYSALQFAYYMGANPIILVGVDHSFSCKGDPNQLITSQSDDSNHFDKRYFGAGIKWNLPDLEESERSYMEAKRAFHEKGRKIYDATVGGKLDVFEKISIEMALKLIC